MSDAYWKCSDGLILPVSPLVPVKGPRAEYGVPSSPEMPSYNDRGNERGAHHVIRDTDPIETSNEQRLQGGPNSSYTGGESVKLMSSGVNDYPIDDPRVMGIAGSEPGAAKSWTIGLGGGRPEVPLPHDSSSTLFVEALPPNCTRREVSHIFRPFAGYREVRLVIREPRYPRGYPFVLCFVDFVSPAHAATAMDTLQGYKFDEHDRDSTNLRLQFARHPGNKSGGGRRTRH